MFNCICFKLLFLLYSIYGQIINAVLVSIQGLKKKTLKNPTDPNLSSVNLNSNFNEFVWSLSRSTIQSLNWL